MCLDLQDSPMKAADPVDVAEDEERPEAADAEVDAEAEIDDEETEKDIEESATGKQFWPDLTTITRLNFKHSIVLKFVHYEAP